MGKGSMRARETSAPRWMKGMRDVVPHGSTHTQTHLFLLPAIFAVMTLRTDNP